MKSYSLFGAQAVKVYKSLALNDAQKIASLGRRDYGDVVEPWFSYLSSQRENCT
jgi:hypothetical protein